MARSPHMPRLLCVMLQWHEASMEVFLPFCWRAAGSMETPSRRCHRSKDASSSLSHLFLTLPSPPLQPWLQEEQFPSTQWSPVTAVPWAKDKAGSETTPCLLREQQVSSEWTQPRNHSSGSEQLRRRCPSLCIRTGPDFVQVPVAASTPRESFRSALHCQGKACCLIFAPCLL